MSRSRAFVLTCNNPDHTKEVAVRTLAETAKYAVVGIEVAPTTGTPHFQGYMYFTSGKTVAAMRKLLPGCHVEAARGRPDQCAVYCSKDGNLLLEKGEMPRQGNRGDIHESVALAKESGRLRDVVLTAKSLQAFKIAECYMTLHEPRRDFKPHIVWIFGPTGTGKSRMARELAPDDTYTKLPGTKWWSGYDAHDNVIMDDFRPCGDMSFNYILVLLDRYECQVETKGGHRQMLAKQMIITTPQHPANTYHNVGEQVEQLLRRIDEIIPVGVVHGPEPKPHDYLE